MTKEQEVIELLKDIRHGIDYEFHGKCRCELLGKCNKALALLPCETCGGSGVVLDDCLALSHPEYEDCPDCQS